MTILEIAELEKVSCIQQFSVSAGMIKHHLKHGLQWKIYGNEDRCRKHDLR